MAETEPRPLTRAELSKFLPNQRAIRAFEKLFDLIPSDLVELSELVQGAFLEAGAANARSAEAVAQLTRIAQNLDVLAKAPRAPLPSRAVLDYLDFLIDQPHAYRVGRLSWDSSCDTLALQHTGGVEQHVGEDLYDRLTTNNLTVQINNGEVIGLEGAGTNIVKFIADGTYDSLLVIGVATQDIPAGGSGRIAVWGRVRGFDTSAFAVGDILYVSTTTAGGFTNVKPTAPHQSIPMGVVLVSDAAAGVMFVRPTIEQQLYFGSFSKTADQTPAAVNTAYPITFDTTELALGVSIGTPASRIVFDNAGLYSFSVSFQLSSGSAVVKNVWLWFRKNGVDVANTALKTSLESNTALATPSRSLFFSLAAGDYIELMWAADSTNVTLDALPATAFAPAAPACLLTVEQIQQ